MAISQTPPALARNDECTHRKLLARCVLGGGNGGVDRKERKDALEFTTSFWICHSLHENKVRIFFLPRWGCLTAGFDVGRSALHEKSQALTQSYDGNIGEERPAWTLVIIAHYLQARRLGLCT
jgi:hypothetical protein